MPKFALKAEPTFTAKVAFPIAGRPAVEVLLTFKHRTKTALEAFLKTREAQTDVQSFLDMVVAWDLADEFTPANVEELLENHIGVAVASYLRYVEELTTQRRGN